MSIRTYKPTSASRRSMTNSTFDEITTKTPEKSLLVSLSKSGGRNNTIFTFMTSTNVAAGNFTLVITTARFG